MTIEAITKSLSASRFATYQLPILGGTSPEQCLGLYLWNKQLASVFLPALQVIEISLRNAIYQSYIQYEEERIERQFASHVWEEKKSQIDRRWFVTAFTQQNNPTAYKGIQTAINQLNKEKKPHTPENIIAKLTFGFWVSMVRNDFDIQKNTYLVLWPRLRGLVFPNALNTQTERPLSINSIGNELKEINKIRNRLSHHEPLWRDQKAYQIEDIINKVIEHYERCLKVIYWINPSNLKLLDIIENNQNMAKLCNIHSLWKNKQLPLGIPSLPINKEWGKSIFLDTSHTGEVIHISGNHLLIKSKKDKAIFFGKEEELHGGIEAYKKHDVVKYYPESSTVRYPNAKRITKV
ncbi:Abi family protein [Xenorhabdus bovienii]|uniref:Abi family protein n=1 Tax=Xenorhabdus bovienii TaxID=40576 RepID=UPI0023B251DE|nr:Abi family protein [Xenorhabdus bovienii]MDE9535867.1 Abi family protein [Xenorhabdus bovienii]MDE9588760.1 Abi family protein [Xenorhabdus bovienii]